MKTLNEILEQKIHASFSSAREGRFDRLISQTTILNDEAEKQIPAFYKAIESALRAHIISAKIVGEGNATSSMREIIVHLTYLLLDSVKEYENQINP